MTDVQAQQLLVIMATAWPDGMRWLTPAQQADTQGLYRAYLVDLDYMVADAALRRLIATWRPTGGRAWPSIAELRSAIVTQQHGRQPSAGEAWGEAIRLRSARSEERWLEVDPLLRRACELMGWVKTTRVLRAVTETSRYRVEMGDNESSDRARFGELWDQLSQREVSDRVMGALADPIPVRQFSAPVEDSGDAAPLGDIVARILLPKKAAE